MKIFTVTKNKIRYWEKVRDIEEFKKNLELTYNIQADCYLIKDNIDFYSINFTNFDVIDDEIIFKFSVYKDTVKKDYKGFPNMTEKEINENYSPEQIDLISQALKKYELQNCKLWDKFIHLKTDPSQHGVVIPDDFPRIPRVLLEFITDEPSFEEVARVKVEKI